MNRYERQIEGRLSHLELQFPGKAAKQCNQIITDSFTKTRLIQNHSARSGQLPFSNKIDTPFFNLRPSREIQDEDDEFSVEDQLQWMEMSKLRRTHLMLQTKQKYERIIQLQHRSFLQRNELQRERENMIHEEKERIAIKAFKVKEQQQKLGLSARNWKTKNLQTAASLREKKLANQYLKFQREVKQLQKKKKLVGLMQKSMSLGRQKVLQMRGQSTDRKRELLSHQQYQCGDIQRVLVFQEQRKKVYKIDKKRLDDSSREQPSSDQKIQPRSIRAHRLKARFSHVG